MVGGDDLVSASFRQLPAERQKAILSAAQDEFSARGFALASTNAIVQACGIAKGSLFNYFKDKEGLFLYLHWLSGCRQLAALRALSADQDKPRSAMDGLIRAIKLSFDLFADNPTEFSFAMTMAGADAAHLVPRYVALFDAVESAELFRAIVTPAGTKAEVAQVLLWMLTGIKLEIQAGLSAARDTASRAATLRGLRASLLERLELARSVIKE
ncbi:MAG: TetR/AcrR family transcriptional regulator [Spirochaetales bacterium]|nr:TetR/AcrR family transcriptional regulator [Spirochaetales bacterium]